MVILTDTAESPGYVVVGAAMLIEVRRWASDKAEGSTVLSIQLAVRSYEGRCEENAYKLASPASRFKSVL